MRGGVIFAENEPTYYISIPDTPNITQAGWNKFPDDISVTSGEAAFTANKIIVTVSSDNNWRLMLSPDKSDYVGYTLASQDNGTQNLTWEFASSEVTAEGTSKTIGVIVEDYSSKPMGTYQDRLIFTVSLDERVPTLNDVLNNGSTLTISFQYNGDNSATFTNNNGTFSETHSGFFIEAARMSINNGNLVAQFDDMNGDFATASEINTITLYPATNTWTFSKGGSTYDTSDYKFAVNGTDITSQLTQQ